MLLILLFFYLLILGIIYYIIKNKDAKLSYYLLILLSIMTLSEMGIIIYYSIQGKTTCKYLKICLLKFNPIIVC